MNETNYRWLRGYLQQLPPSAFDYNSCDVSIADCPCCVAAHVVRAGRADSDRWGDAEADALIGFLDISDEDALALYLAHSQFDGLSLRDRTYPEWAGSNGIARAILVLDEIAAKHGLSPDGSDIGKQDAPTFTGDAEAFLAKLRAEIETGELIATK